MELTLEFRRVADVDWLGFYPLRRRSGLYNRKLANAGRSWRQRDTTSKTRVAWAAPGKLYTAGLDGTVRLSSDAGRSWKPVGTIGAAPMDFVAGPDGELFAYLSGGKVARSTDGGKTWSQVVRVS